MSRSKTYGAPPNQYVRVRVQKVEDGKHTRTESFAIHGETYEDVKTTVENALDNEYGGAEEEEEEAPPVAVRLKKRGKK